IVPSKGGWSIVSEEGFLEFPTKKEAEKAFNTPKTHWGTHERDHTKTRRILEVQSDLFQKGRSEKNLTGKNISFSLPVSEMTTLDEFNKKAEDFRINHPQNQFLQLLNKNNNWVTFFVKSIIQDSAKKG